MLFFTSPLDQAADHLISSRFRVAQAERRGYGAEAARLELKIAEAAWQAVCDGAKSRAKAERRAQQNAQVTTQLWTKRTLSAVLGTAKDIR